MAACIGNQFDLGTLAVASEQSQLEVAESLWNALQEGLVLPKGETYKFFQGSDRAEEKTLVENISVAYKFLHDRVQQAAYSLIPPEEKQRVHLRIGRLLWQKTPEEQLDDKLFDIVNQLNIGAAIIEEIDRREELARLNLRAAQKAKTSTAYEGAIACAEAGLSLLPEEAWHSHYILTRDLTVVLAEAEYLNACGEECLTCQDRNHVKPYEMLFTFYYTLSLVAMSGEAGGDRQDYLRRAEEQQQRLENWAKRFPLSFQHKRDLVEAEKARMAGNILDAIGLYDRAIALAQESKFIHDEALANELAAKFYLDWGKEKIAATYMQEAYYCYARWGAKGKTDDLEKRYPTLLAPTLERQKLSLTPSATVATMKTGTISKTTTGTGEILDLATLMKASRTLNEDISLQGAIANLMKVAMENAGAQTVALMLFQEQVLMLSAVVSAEEVSEIHPIPVETSNAVPLSIVNKVKRSREPLVLDDASKENAYTRDAYIQQHQPQSILCLPLSDRGKLIGILYLENNRVAGAFTGDRVEVLTLLCSQAAISLENARLYQKSLNYAQQLEHTQLQLVQSEKMASIGELAAGVAHEINNPVGFISGNLDYAFDYFQDMINLLNLYRQTFPQPGEKIEEEMEAMELDYLIEDLPQTLGSMKEGIDRITEISKSMRTFSRGDTAAKVAFNIHEGIDSTLLILKHRLKANQKRPQIEIVKKYGELPEVNCYPGQLNQVFMNLIANAIDAFDEGNVGRTFDEIKAAPNRIAITTEFHEKKKLAIVKIRDNGIGMSEEVKAKVFQHLFTTKGVGKGTGLGLSISRQIVE